MDSDRTESAVASAQAVSRPVDLTTRSCPQCKQPMDRTDYLDSEESTQPRVVFHCVDCGEWEEVLDLRSLAGEPPA